MKALQEHLRDCKKQRQQKDPEQPERSYMCEFCSKLFPKLADLNRHIKRVHEAKPCTATVTKIPPAQSCSNDMHTNVPTTTVNDLGSDPDIGFDEVINPVTSNQESTSESDPTSRKPTRPELPIGTKKRKLSFDLGQKVIASGTETTTSIEAPVLHAKKYPVTSSESRKVTIKLPTATVSRANDGNINEAGVQCSIGTSLVEHHRIIETVRTYKENDADVTQKEVHETRWWE